MKISVTLRILNVHCLSFVLVYGFENLRKFSRAEMPTQFLRGVTPFQGWSQLLNYRSPDFVTAVGHGARVAC